jgi:type I restriction enzyme S subunit
MVSEINWTNCTLGDAVTLKRGYDLPARDRVDGAYPIVSSSGVTGSHNVAMVRGPGVVTGRYGTLGQVFYVPSDFWPLNTSLYVQDFKGNHPLFISYLLQTLNFGQRSGAAAVPGVNRNALHMLPIRKPDLSTQRKIAAILSAYDNLIENNLWRIKILEEISQNLYREWFVKFRFPGYQHARFTDCPLGRIPEGWEVASISDVAIIHRGRSYKGTELADEGGRPFINLKCIERDGGFRSSGLKRYTGPFKDTHTVRAGEMVMAITDMTQERRIVARVGRVSRFDADFGVISMDLVRVTSRGNLSETYLYAMLRWSGFADEVKQHANGANVLHLLPDRIEEYRFICPTLDIALRFGEIVLPMLSLCDSLEHRNTILRRARDLLLPKLISGEVEVLELDIAVPEEDKA